MKVSAPWRCRLARRPEGNVDLMLGIALALLTVALTLPALRAPSFVASVTVINTSDHDLHVDVRNPRRRGWMDLGSVAANSVLTTQEVLDQGGEWTFRFTERTEGSATLTFLRTRLVAQHWRLEVPAWLIEARRTLEQLRSPELDAAESP